MSLERGYSMVKIDTRVHGLIGTNCYVLSIDGECIIIDMADGSGGKIADYLVKQNLTPLAVLITHGHFDHCSGLRAFLKKFPVKVYMHEADIKKKSDNTIFVNDNDVLKIGRFEIKAIHTPGHTKGGLCYVVEKNIFSGDTLFHEDAGRTDLAGGSELELRQSIKKLYALDGNFVVYPGHMESTTLDEERENNSFQRAK